jgi:uncharacterized delta-60 repeat protein
VTFDVYQGSSDVVEGVVMLGDGSIIVAASMMKFYPVNGNPLADEGEMEEHFALRRFTPDGEPDPDFGDNGQVLTTFLRPRSEVVNGTEVFYSPAAPGITPTLPTRTSALAVLPDGRIVVGGSVSSSIALARYNSDGSPDTTFGEGGQLRAPQVNPGSFATVNDTVPLSDGRMLVLGGANAFRFEAGKDPVRIGMGVVAAFNRDGRSTRASAGATGSSRSRTSGITPRASARTAHATRWAPCRRFSMIPGPGHFPAIPSPPASATSPSARTAASRSTSRMLTRRTKTLPAPRRSRRTAALCLPEWSAIRASCPFGGTLHSPG